MIDLHQVGPTRVFGASVCTQGIGQVGMTSLQVNCSLTEVNASVFIAVF